MACICAGLVCVVALLAALATIFDARSAIERDEHHIDRGKGS